MCRCFSRLFRKTIFGSSTVNDEQNTVEQRAEAAKEHARKAHLIAVDSRLGQRKDPNPLHTTAALDLAKANSASSAADKDKESPSAVDSRLVVPRMQ